VVGPPTTDAGRVAAVREALPAVGAGIYLDTPVAGPLPAESAHAMAEIAGWELTTGRVHRDRRDDVRARVDEARGAAAAILAADLDEVDLAPGMDAALVRAVRAVDWQPGDRLLAVADADLARLVRLAPPGVQVDLLAPDADVVGPIDARTRLVALPLVTASTGARLPVEAIGRAARQVGARVLVDVSLALGAVPVDRAALGADLLVCRSEAWLLGPEGLALVAGDGIEPDDDPRFHLPSVAGFARGCGWLSMYVGLPWIHARCEATTRRAAERLAAIDGLTLLTPEDRAATLVFTIEGWDAADALDELGARIFLLASALPVGGIRIGIGPWTTDDEIDRLIETVALLATHDAATLPRRPTLTILGSGRR
jgi:selenocysteine lyase/cysteine desulfurase